MQSLSGSRASKRSIPDPASQAQDMASEVSQSTTASGARTSSSSSRTSALRRQNPGQQLSQIEKSVTHLLIATKQLLETLTQWSRHNSTEGEVSDVYVRLGYEFNIACRAFNGIGVDTSDLGPVPELLRAILEETLSQEASPASLDKYLPRIRDIIITLLHGLKRKQQKLRAKQSKDAAQGGEKVSNSTSANSLNAGLTQMLEDAPGRPVRPRERRTGSAGSSNVHEREIGETAGVRGQFDESPVRQSAGSVRQISGGDVQTTLNRQPNRGSFRPPPASASESNPTMNGVLYQQSNMTGPHDFDAQQVRGGQGSSGLTMSRDNGAYLHAPPPPPPKQQDALAALQRGGDLERRASRRYSAYQISKHLGASPNGMPMLPPAQTTPVPNRGRDVRDSMNAVRVRGSGIYNRQRTDSRATSSSPSRIAVVPDRIAEERGASGSSNHKTDFERTESGDLADGEPRDKIEGRTKEGAPHLSASLSGPIETLPSYDAISHDAQDSQHPSRQTSLSSGKSHAPLMEDNQLISQFVPEQSPQPGKELTLFLQYKSRIKKFVLPGGSNDLSVARLQLAFIEKFAWNTHSNGLDLPEIYVQDPVSGVRHELEDLRDVKDRCVLVLNIEALDEVKKHFDENFGGLRKIVETIASSVSSQQQSIQRFSEQQYDASREVHRLSSKPDLLAGGPSDHRHRMNGNTKRPGGSLKSSQDDEVTAVRQDLAIIRQTFATFVADVNTSMSTVREKAASVKTMAIEGVVPDLDASTGRSYVNTGKKTLSDESEKIVNVVDDLQDIVEDLRKDVVTRGVRPVPRQLEDVGKSISVATTELKKLQEYLRREKPIWTKIWEKELEVVCNDRDLLTMQEELAADLEDDLDKATQTFALVEQATKQQNIQSAQGSGTTLRNTSRGLAAIAIDQEIDPIKAKDGVLGEVRALRPNHEDRLEAIQRAEKARQRDLESREGGAFTKEVASFVEGNRLKKSGGVEETERLRKQRDEQNMRNAWEVQQGRAAAKGKEMESSTAPQSEPEPVEHVIDPELQGTPDRLKRHSPTEHMLLQDDGMAAEKSQPEELENLGMENDQI